MCTVLHIQFGPSDVGCGGSDGTAVVMMITLVLVVR